jgi:hypothetical protein
MNPGQAPRPFAVHRSGAGMHEIQERGAGLMVRRREGYMMSGAI